MPSMGWKRLRSCAMKKLHEFSDIHSHDKSLATQGNTVVNILPGEKIMTGGHYSVGIHPWDSEKPVTLRTLKSLVAMARNEQIVAIGECGFDRLRGADMEKQRQIFDFHARLAERYNKPLIIHSVKANDELIAAIRRHRPSVEWIIHGFRGKPELARQLIREGFSISLSSKYNPTVAQIIPTEKLYHETDSQPDIVNQS